MTLFRSLKRATLMLAVAVTPALAELPVLTIASQAGGTVAWELDTIRHHGFDEAHGFRLEVQEVAGKAAGQIAFRGGEVDVIVDDWIWVARQRVAGHDITFIPYSRAVGGVMVPQDSNAQALRDLTGTKIGIAGGPNDKSWIILRAYAAQQGFDLFGRDRTGLWRTAIDFPDRAVRRDGRSDQFLAFHGQAGSRRHAPSDFGRRGCRSSWHGPGHAASGVCGAIGTGGRTT